MPPAFARIAPCSEVEFPSSVPALIVVPPLYVLAPVRVNVPGPCFVRAPAPEITPA